MNVVNAILWLVIALGGLATSVLVLHRLELRDKRAELRLFLGGLTTISGWMAATQAPVLIRSEGFAFPLKSVPLLAPHVMSIVTYFGVLAIYLVEGALPTAQLALGLIGVSMLGGLLLPLAIGLAGLYQRFPLLIALDWVASARQWLAGVAAFVIGLYLMLIVYQWLANRWPRRATWLASGGALLIAGWTKSTLFVFGSYWGEPFYRDALLSEILGWGVTALLLWPFVVLHFKGLRALGFEGSWAKAHAPWDVLRETLDLRSALERTQHRLDQLYQNLKLLTDARELVVRAREPKQLLEDVCGLLRASRHYTRVWVGLVREGDRAIYPAGQLGLAGELPVLEAITSQDSASVEGIIGRVLRGGEPVVVRDLEDDPSDKPAPRSWSPPHTQALAVIPLRLGKLVPGVLNVSASVREAFDRDEVQMLQAVADDLTYGLSRLQSETQREQRVRELETIRELTEAMISQDDVPTLLKHIVEKATDLLDSNVGGLFLCDPEKRVVRFEVGCRTPGAYAGKVFNYDEGAAGAVAASGEPLIIADYHTWNGAAQEFVDGGEFRSLLGVPMIWQGRVRGVIELSRSDDRRPFSRADLDLLSLFANQAAMMLEHASLVEDTRRRVNELALLNDITRAALSAADLESMANVLAERMRELIDADAYFLTLWDPAREAPIPKAAFGPARDRFLRLEFPPRVRTLTESALQAGHVLVIEDVADSPHVDPQIAALYPARSFLALPLVAADAWLGAILIAFQDLHAFGPEETTRCEQAADQMALALAKSLAIEAERKRGEELEAMRQASLGLTSSLELQPVLEAILEHALKLVDADDAHVFFYDGQELTFAAAKWAGQTQRSPYAQPRQNGLTYTVARNGERIVAEDVRRHPLFADKPWDGAIVGLPLRVGDAVLGVMTVAFARPHTFDENELRVLGLLADQAAIGLENARLFERTHAGRQRVQFLYNLTQELTTSLNPAEILGHAVALTKEYLGAESCEAFKVEPGSDRLRLLASSRGDGFSVEELDERLDIRLGKGLVGWVAESRQPSLVPDVALDARWQAHPGLDDGVRSAICAPVIADGESVGVLSVFHQEREAFDQEHLDLLESISRQVALALSNAERYQQIQRQLAELTAVQQVAQVVNRRLEMQALLDEVALQVSTVLGYPVVEIFLVEEDELALRAYESREPVRKRRLSISQGIIGRVTRTNQVAFVPDVRFDQDYVQGVRSTQSEIAVPLRKGEMVIGALNVESPEPGGLTEDDLRLLTLLADQVSVAIENAALYDRLQQHTYKLEQIITERTAELAKALNQARQAERLKSRFIADVSHELRTPLSNIRLYLELLVSGRPERAREYLDTLNRETDRLIVLIEDLLAISRLDAGTVTINPVHLEINAIAKLLVEDRQRLCASRQLELDLVVGEGLPPVTADERLLSQVVANLVTNAMNYTPAGGKVTVQTALREQDGQRWVTLAVKDTGLGIPPQERGRLFERFFRGSASRQMNVPGTGLGLAICKEILDRHDGWISVESQVGRGSEFTIWLPPGEPGGYNDHQVRGQGEKEDTA